MKYIDLHADTILPILQEGEEASLYENSHTAIDVKKLQAGDSLAQSFAVWIPDGEYEGIEVDPVLAPNTPEEDKTYINLAIDRLNKEIAENADDIAWATNTDEILANEKAGKISALLTLEDARTIDNSMDNIDWLKEKGFQMIGLMWNHENCIGYPNSADDTENQKGLKPFGIEAIEYIESLGMILDVAHLNDGGIADVLAHAKHPVVASHSNARAIANHSRNLIDEYIKAIADTGGVAGLALSPRFLQGYDAEDSKIDDMIRHLDHMVEVGGEDVLAIGTDFDGTSGNLEIASADAMPKLFERLDDHGWPIERIEKLAHKNVLRLYNK